MAHSPSLISRKKEKFDEKKKKKTKEETKRKMDSKNHDAGESGYRSRYFPHAI